MTDQILITVSGPQGIGKTQLIDQILKALGADRNSRVTLVSNARDLPFAGVEGSVVGSMRPFYQNEGVIIAVRETNASD